MKWDAHSNYVHTLTAGALTLFWLLVIGVVLLTGGQPPDSLLVLDVLAAGFTWAGVIRYDRRQRNTAGEPELERLR